MATAEQIMHDEFFDLVMSKNLTADVLKDPEIVAFLQAKNLPTDIDVNNTPLKYLKFANFFLIKKTT